MSILLDVYGMSFMFFRLVVVDGVGWLVSHFFDYIGMEENSMCFDEAQDATAT